MLHLDIDDCFKFKHIYTGRYNQQNFVAIIKYHLNDYLLNAIVS